MTTFRCPRCKQQVSTAMTGESGIYGSHHILCEPCFEDEDQEIEQAGTNDLPQTLARYGLANG